MTAPLCSYCDAPATHTIEWTPTDVDRVCASHAALASDPHYAPVPAPVVRNGGAA